MDIKLAIFDFDGTIMDTREAIVFAKQETMRQMGLPVADAQACAGTIGLSGKLGFKQLFPEMSDDKLELCIQNYRRIFDDTKEKVPPTLFPGIINTLDQLQERGVMLTIATSRNRKSLIEFLDQMKIAKYFSYVLAAEDTSLLKPNPDPVIKTLKDLSYSSNQALVIGDMPYDIQMGKSAGVYTCGVTYGNSDRIELSQAGADFIIDRISELVGILL